MRSIQLVIDTGSKFTTISQQGKGFVLKDASLVFIENKNNKISLIEVGRGVASYIGQQRPNEQAIYPIKEGTIYHERAAVLMYRAFLNKIAGESLFRPKIKAIACVSCGLTNTEKHDIEKVLTQAGVSEVVILESPLAAYAAVADGSARCIVDIGASKTEVAIVNRQGIVAGCSLNIGGNSFNQAIMDYILDEKRCRLAPERVEKLKKQLATLSDSENFAVNEVVTEIGAGTQTQIQIHSSEIKKALEPYVAKICTTILSILSQTPENLVDEVTANGILLCGGSSRINGLCEYIANDVGLMVARAENPENIIVNGGMYFIEHRDQLANLLNVVNLK